jgi:hypothetical protein
MSPIRLREEIAHPNGLTGGTMKRAICVALGTAAIVSSAAALSIGAATPGDEWSIGDVEYVGALRALEAQRQALGARCEALAAGQERELCRAEAAAYDMVRAADLEARFRRTELAQRAAQRARIDARYHVDRARCGAYSGFKRDRCLVQAHATKGRALLEAAGPYEVRF